MSYTTLATRSTPALIIYLLDVSGSMQEPMGGISKIDLVAQALQKTAVRMVQRSTKGTVISPRYKVAMFAYSSSVIDLLGGIKTIDELAKMGTPQLMTLDTTDTAAAFAEVERLLQQELPDLQDCPAPLVCHLTDGYYNGADPKPLVERIKRLSVPDGDVLVENIFVTSTGPHIADVRAWPGISSEDELADPYARDLFHMSSLIPDSYLNVMREFGYKLEPGARMIFPGNQPDLVQLGFVMSGATPITAAA
jgi:hypothetical protein